MQKSLNAAGIAITVDQWVVIDHILPNPGISQNDLAKLTAKDAPTVTRILELLINKDWVRRGSDKKDRRRSQLFLTEEGKELHKKAFQIVAGIRSKAWENLSDEDYAQLVRIMETIHANIN